MKSGGRATQSSFIAEVFYAPVYRSLTRIAGQQNTASIKNNEGEVKTYTSTAKKDSLSKAHDSGKAIIRFVTHPLCDKAPLVAADLSARRIGLEVLRSQITNPIQNGMSQ